MSTAEWLKPLPPEPWGRKLKRAREDVAGIGTREAARLIGRYVLTSAPTVSRLEAFALLPPEPLQRARAYLACLIYGVDPADLGLSSGDLPPGLEAALDGVPQSELLTPSVTGRYLVPTWWDAAA